MRQRTVNFQIANEFRPARIAAGAKDWAERAHRISVSGKRLATGFAKEYGGEFCKAERK